MGTRSLTHIKGDVWKQGETPQTLVTIYRQMDGYPSGHGEDLAKFLRGRRIVNGIGGDASNISNGMGCLAASLIEELKGGRPGGIYIYPADSFDVGEEYTYTISNDAPRGGSNLRLQVQSARGLIFDGAPEDFVGEAVEAQSAF